MLRPDPIRRPIRLTIRLIKNIFINVGGFLQRNVWTIVPALGALGGIIIVIGMPFLNFGGDSLRESSKNAECGHDLQESLRAFSQQMDMQYDIGADDYKVIFNTGEIQKEYYRDGIRYTAYFHLDKTDSGCCLKFYKRGMKEPGVQTTSLGNYGSIALDKCQCNGGKDQAAGPSGEGEKVQERIEPKEGKNFIWIDLGKKDQALLLTLAPNSGDGITEPDVKSGVDCRKLPFPYDGSGDNHMYFGIDDEFLRSGNNEVWIVMEYFDSGTRINCQYDGNGAGPVDGAFRGAHDGAFPMLELTNTNTWKFHGWHITDGKFANRCNGFDFRFSTHAGGSMWVNRVWLFLYEPPDPFNPGAILP
ncbi:MAG TPA: hypothetical protein VM658_11445 [bacterium]|nr:hypothetical protein [bacterium]